MRTQGASASAYGNEKKIGRSRRVAVFTTNFTHPSHPRMEGERASRIDETALRRLQNYTVGIATAWTERDTGTVGGSDVE